MGCWIILKERGTFVEFLLLVLDPPLFRILCAVNGLKKHRATSALVVEKTAIFSIKVTTSFALHFDITRQMANNAELVPDSAP